MSIAPGEVSAGSRLWVPSVDEWSAMGWYGRKRFVEDRRPVAVRVVKKLVECERRHAEDKPVQPGPSEPVLVANRIDPPRMFTADELHYLAELRRVRSTPTVWPEAEAAEHWADLEREQRRLRGYDCS